MRLGECKVCGEQAYYRGKESDWKISFQPPTEPNSSTWVHKDWGKKEFDHDAEPVVYTHMLVIEVDSHLSSSQDVFFEVQHQTFDPFRPKLVGHKILGKGLPQ